MKNKVKEFTTKHKKKLAVAAGIGLVSVGVVVGRKTVFKQFENDVFVTHEGIKNILLDAQKDYDRAIYTGIRNSEVPLKPADLGDLGKSIIDCGGEGYGFTHFIAIGDKLNVEE